MAVSGSDVPAIPTGMFARLLRKSVRNRQGGAVQTHEFLWVGKDKQKQLARHLPNFRLVVTVHEIRVCSFPVLNNFIVFRRYGEGAT